MKITQEDMDKLMRLFPGDVDSSGLRMAVLRILIDIWDRGYNEAFNELRDSYIDPDS